MKRNARFFKEIKAAIELETLGFVILLVVFLFVAVMAIILMWQQGNIFGGDGSVCERTGWLLGGCT